MSFARYKVGPTRDRLVFVDRLLFALLLRPQIADTERQEAAVTGSSLDWLVVRTSVALSVA